MLAVGISIRWNRDYSQTKAGFYQLYENNAEGVFQAFERMMKYHKSIKAGELFITGERGYQEFTVVGYYS